jgi:aspartate kinase
MEKIKVLKFGGSVLLNKPECLARFRDIVRFEMHAGHKLIVVVSAFDDTTNTLIKMFGTSNVDQKMMDFLLPTGEMQAVAITANYLIQHGIRADCFTGGQAGIFTDFNFGNANIINIDTKNIINSLKINDVAVVSGFQGGTSGGIADGATKREITTLGRNGSDTTAFHMTHYFNAASCSLFKDVDGVFADFPTNSRMYKYLNYRDVLDGRISGIIHEKALRFCEKMFAENARLEIIVRNFNSAGHRFTTICNKQTKIYRGS